MAGADKKCGLLYAMAAYSTWGLLPVYWKLLSKVSALEILCHRIIWSAIFLLVLIFSQKQLAELKTIIKTEQKARFLLIIGGLLIGGNWYLYIWAINNNRILDATLGYFIYPLLSVVLGTVFLGEKLSMVQWFAVILASAGVVNITVSYCQFPWLSIALATTFAFYSLVKKVVSVKPLSGLWIEAVILFIPALICLMFERHGNPNRYSAHVLILLIGAGIVTAMPLLWFAKAAQGVKLTTLGFLQYLSPSLNFLLAIFIYKETFTAGHFVTFIFIWTALAIFSFGGIGRKVKFMPIVPDQL